MRITQWLDEKFARAAQVRADTLGWQDLGTSGKRSWSAARRLWSSVRIESQISIRCQDSIVGCFGIESYNETNTELRRMYLDRGYRASGVAKRMLDVAEERARELSFTKMLVSTAEIQRAADLFYRRNGFRQVRVEVAQTMTAKQAGGGLTRFYFEKKL